MKIWSLILAWVMHQCHSALTIINGANCLPKCEMATSCGHFQRVMKAGKMGADGLAYRLFAMAKRLIA